MENEFGVEVLSRKPLRNVGTTHFDHLAQSYDSVRTLDPEPIEFLANELPVGNQYIAELGCGTGRYLLPLIGAFGTRNIQTEKAYGVDLSQEMLDQAERESAGVDLDIEWLQGTSCDTGIPDAGLTLVTSFNSFHHFPVEATLAEIERILRPGQFFAIYIRTHEQEEEHIWGRWFPDYLQHTIVPSAETLRNLSEVRASYSLELSKDFSFERHASLDRILSQTKRKHYSTLSLYRPEAFDEGLIQFEDNLRSNYRDPLRISYPSSYGLFVYRVG